jgi:tetratricopeptide (TPR) repeat protein
MLDRVLENAARCCTEERCEEAVDLLEQAVRLQPGNPGLYYRLGACQSGGCRAHAEVNAPLAIEYLRHALSLSNGPAASALRARVLDTLGNLYGRTGRSEEAAECHAGAAALYRGRGELEDWARAEFNLGNVCCELEKWAEAITHYEHALEVRTRDCQPARYAATLDNLGTAWRQLPSGDRSGNILKALDCYRRALRVYTAAVFPVQNASLHNNIGNAWLSLEGQRNARRALRHLNRSLALRAPTGHEYAATQFNRGQAFLRLGDQVAAAGCFREACACWTTCNQTSHAEMALRQLERIEAMHLPVAV